MRLATSVSNRANSALWITLTMAAALVAASTACGNSASNTGTTATPSQPTYPSTPPVAITWSPQTSPLPAPPAQVPPPSGSNDFPLTLTSPTEGAASTSPLHVVASAAPQNPIFFMRVYVDQLAVYFTFTASIDTQIFVGPGQHAIEVMAEDNQGYISATIVNVNIGTQSSTTISSIQAMPGWQSCSATFPAGSGRDGQICAAGLGTADSTMTANQTTPALDGNSAKFTMGGPTPYSNILYFNPVAGGNNVSHFTYDLYFYIDNPNASQALEFDINQT